VEVDLPVGDNLQDHLMERMDFHDNTTSTVNIEKLTTMPLMQYFSLGSGLLTYSMICEFLMKMFYDILI
jgi:hypothetical protein